MTGDATRDIQMLIAAKSAYQDISEFPVEKIAAAIVETMTHVTLSVESV